MQLKTQSAQPLHSFTCGCGKHEHFWTEPIRDLAAKSHLTNNHGLDRPATLIVDNHSPLPCRDCPTEDGMGCTMPAGAMHTRRPATLTRIPLLGAI